MLKEIYYKLKTHDGLKPSCCFCTFLSAQPSLNCTDISNDASYIYGGFDDSSIRLYSFRSRPLTSKRKSSNHMASKEICDGQQTLLRAHEGPVYTVRLSNDNQFLLSGSADSTVRLWSTELRSNLVAYKAHRGPVWDVSFSPRGHLYVSGGADRTAKLWIPERKESLRIFEGHQSDVDCVTWHPSCHYVITGSSDCSARLWDIQTGKCVRVFRELRTPITSIAACPDGKTVVVGTQDGQIKIWELGENKSLGILRNHSESVWSLAFTSEPPYTLATGGGDGIIRIWNFSTINIRDNVPSTQSLANPMSGLLATWVTKQTLIYSLRFIEKNFLAGAGF